MSSIMIDLTSSSPEPEAGSGLGTSSVLPKGTVSKLDDSAATLAIDLTVRMDISSSDDSGSELSDTSSKGADNRAAKRKARKKAAKARKLAKTSGSPRAQCVGAALSPCGGIDFTRMHHAARAATQLGGRRVARTKIGQKRRVWSPSCTDAVRTQLLLDIENCSFPTKERLGEITGREGHKAYKRVMARQELNQLYKTARAAAIAAGKVDKEAHMRKTTEPAAATPAAAMSAAVKPVLVLASRERLAALPVEMAVGSHIHMYAAAFQCACGGALKVMATSKRAKSWGSKTDYPFWMGCTEYRRGRADSCHAKYTQANLESAVELARG